MEAKVSNVMGNEAMQQAQRGHLIKNCRASIRIYRHLDESGYLTRITGKATVIPDVSMTDEDYASLDIAKPAMARNLDHLKELLINGLNRTSLVGVRLLIDNRLNAAVLSVRHEIKKGANGWKVIKENPEQKVNDFLQMISSYPEIGIQTQVEVIQVAKKFISFKSWRDQKEVVNADTIAVAEKYQFGTSDQFVYVYAPTALKLLTNQRGESYVIGINKTGNAESASLKEAILNAQTENIAPPIIVSEVLMTLPSVNDDADDEIVFDGTEILDEYRIHMESEHQGISVKEKLQTTDLTVDQKTDPDIGVKNQRCRNDGYHKTRIADLTAPPDVPRIGRRRHALR